MAQQLRVLQSLWAMERRLADEDEWPLQTQLAMIRDAGFDGAGVRFIDPAFA
ncbi:sugar phosphate isomerase/epimerase, partial [Streptococcus pyogenes]